MLKLALRLKMRFLLDLGTQISKRRKSDRVPRVPELESQDREVHSLPLAQRLVSWIDLMEEVEQNLPHFGESFKSPQDPVSVAKHPPSLKEVLKMVNNNT